MDGYNPRAWDAQGIRVHTDLLVRPRLIELAGEVEGLTVVDCGSGDGRLARALASKGATVEDFDTQHEMVIRATERGTMNGRISYRVGDIRSVDELYQSEGFDLAVISTGQRFNLHWQM